MPSKTSRKGFKVVSSKKVAKESLTYEEAENEHTITPINEKSERKNNASVEKTISTDRQDSARKRVRDIPIQEKIEVEGSGDQERKRIKEQDGEKKKKKRKVSKKSKSSEHNEQTFDRESSSSLPMPTQIVKTYYPKIPFDCSQYSQLFLGTGEEPKTHNSEKRKSMNKSPGQSDLSHQEKAVALVSTICETEQKGLEEFFSTNHSSRDSILHSITAVISKLPSALQDQLEHIVSTDGSLVFDPEISSHERSIIQKRREYLRIVTSELNKLQECLNDTKKLEENLGSSAVGIPIAPKSVTSGTTMDQDIMTSSQAEKIYLSHLNNINNHVTTVQAMLDDMTASMTSARVAQDDLYDACQRVRFAQHPAASVSSSSPTSTPSAPIFVSSRNFGVNTRSRSSRKSTSAKQAVKKLQRI